MASMALNIMSDNEGKMPSKSIKMARRSTPAGEKNYRYVKEVPLVAEDIMTELPPGIGVDSLVVDAAKMMISEHVIGLPVINGNEIVGMISRKHVLKTVE
jgi:CBS domain-containing protein